MQASPTRASMRPLVVADAKAVAWLLAEDDIRVALGLPRSAGMLDALALASGRETLAQWAVLLSDEAGFSPRLVGLCGLTAGAEAEPDFWYALDARARGVGLMTAAARTALKHGFDDFGLASVGARTSAANRKSRALLKRLSFRHLGAGRFRLSREAFAASLYRVG